MKLFLAYHNAAVLNDCLAPRNTTRLHLDTLDIDPRFQHNPFAESRGLLWLAAQDHDTQFDTHDFTAFMQASYPHKFCMLPPLTNLPTPHFPNHVYGCVTTPHWVEQANRVHPGMDIVLEGVLRDAGIPLRQRPGPLCNSFIAHRDVWKRFLAWYPQAMDAALDHALNPSWVTGLRGKPGMDAAYLCERLTTGWFAAQDDLYIDPLTSNDGTMYACDFTPLLQAPSTRGPQPFEG